MPQASNIIHTAPSPPALMCLTYFVGYHESRRSFQLEILVVYRFLPGLSLKAS
jgi:hypothetical protein